VADFPAGEFQLDGDPGAVRGSATQWSQFGEAANDAAADIRSLDSSLFIGPEGDQYRDGLNTDLPPHLDVTGTAYTNVGAALSSFADSLSGLQDRMSPLRVRAPGLWDALQAAKGRVSSAQTADSQHEQQLVHDALTRPPLQPAPPDNYHSDLGVANGSLAAAQQAWDNCLGSARSVKTDLQTAVDNCKTTIKTAADSRFAHNPHGWGALVAGFKNFVKDHVAALAKLSGVLKLVSGVCGVLSFIPVIGEAALAVSLVTGGLALAIDASIKFSTGQGSWTSIMVDGALMVVPFGLGKGLELARGAEGAEGLVEAGDGIVRFRPPTGASVDEVAQVQRYVDTAEQARLDGRLSESGRVSTQGELRREASRAAARERIRADNTGTPYSGQVGHAPDTTWTGDPEAYEWQDQTGRVNASLGAQARNYPIGFKPSGFEFDPRPIGQ
jgi:hypothetical protein